MAAASGASAQHAAVAGWRSLARAGQHRAALDAAIAQGYEHALAGASLADLILLADSARYAGDAARAKQALLAARARGEKGRTAFLLGKLAADAANAPSEATTWFETYLAEAPSGAFAEHALGRLIELHQRAGNTSAARTAASQYIERHPSGGYAAAARAVVGQ
jgi:hypothetical protein